MPKTKTSKTKARRGRPRIDANGVKVLTVCLRKQDEATIARIARDQGLPPDGGRSASVRWALDLAGEYLDRAAARRRKAKGRTV